MPGLDNTSRPGFVDVQGDAVWARAIRDLSVQGYVRGRGDNRFEPEAGITEAEMSVLLLRASHGPDYLPPSSGGEWWQDWNRAASAEGLMAVIQDPDAPATRAEVATLMWLAMSDVPGPR